MAGALVLGPVLFQGFEIPEQIRFGGKQRLVVHVLPGGGRVVDAMGADEGPIAWSGVFSGPSAAARVRLLEQLRRNGSAVLLTWEGWRYTVIVETFEATSTNPAWIPYSLKTCVVAVSDIVLLEAAIAAGSAIEAASLGAGPGLDGRIDVATGQLGSSDVGAAIAAAGVLARLVTARAYASGTGLDVS